jgi:hypothetical protein
MRVAATVLGAVLVSAPALAQFNQAPHVRRECRILTRQIERYEKDVDRAQDRGNPRWEAAMEAQIDRLVERRAARCPGYPDPKAPYKMMAKWIDLAADLAWKYFTWKY